MSIGGLGYDAPPTPAPIEARLIVKSGTLSSATARRDCDARTALTRGLAEYTSHVQIDGARGRHFAFYRVFDAWAESEDDALYPSAAVYSDAPATYEASRLTPGVGSAEVAPGLYLVNTSEMGLDLTLDVYTSDPVERSVLTAGLEDAMNPVDWRYGFFLDLPYYFGARASYELISSSYLDSEDASQQRRRQMQMLVRGTLTVSRLAEYPLSSPRVRTTTQ